MYKVYSRTVIKSMTTNKRVLESGHSREECTSTIYDEGIDYQAHNLQTDLLLHIMFFHCIWII